MRRSPEHPEGNCCEPQERAVRSREQLDADRYTEDFLKRNRPSVEGMERKLAYYGEHPGWVRRWVNDQGSRIAAMLDRGWRFVLRSEVGMSDSIGRGNTDVGDRVSVATTAGEGQIRTVLMELPQKLYDMYAAARTEPARRVEAAIRAGAFGVDDKSHVYQPKWAENRIETKSAA
jgi:hypothetical protein